MFFSFFYFIFFSFFPFFLFWIFLDFLDFLLIFLAFLDFLGFFRFFVDFFGFFGFFGFYFSFHFFMYFIFYFHFLHFIFNFYLFHLIILFVLGKLLIRPLNITDTLHAGTKEDADEKAFTCFNPTGSQVQRRLIGPSTFTSLLPFHMVFERDLRVRQCGLGLLRKVPHLLNSDIRLNQVARIVRPNIALNFEAIQVIIYFFDFSYFSFII